MLRPNIQIGDDVREMTQDEHEQWKSDSERLKAFFAQQATAAEAAAAAKVSARAKLKALGLTDDEVAALVG